MHEANRAGKHYVHVIQSTLAPDGKDEQVKSCKQDAHSPTSTPTTAPTPSGGPTFLFPTAAKIGQF